eukprot:6176675-Pleurochrysis_carterae.AAC.1
MEEWERAHASPCANEAGVRSTAGIIPDAVAGASRTLSQALPLLSVFLTCSLNAVHPRVGHVSLTSTESLDVSHCRRAASAAALPLLSLHPAARARCSQAATGDLLFNPRASKCAHTATASGAFFSRGLESSAPCTDARLLKPPRGSCSRTTRSLRPFSQHALSFPVLSLVQTMCSVQMTARAAYCT